MKFILASLLLCFGSLVSSCTTGAYSTYDYEYSISDIQKAVSENLPQGIGAINSNRRIFYSKKFTVSQEKRAKFPMIVRVEIRGDRRPYSLYIEVRKVASALENIEDAFDKGDSFESQKSLAKRVVTRIEDSLAQRRKSKNLFDDFRPF